MSADRFVGHRARCVLLAMTLHTPAVALAAPSSSPEPPLDVCIRKAAEGRIWLEHTLWALRDQESGWQGAQVLNRNGTHDLGPLQVNSSWVAKIAAATGRPTAYVRHWLTYDVCFNVEVAKWIFLQGLRATGDYWKAVGAYHSPTPWRQRQYVGSVVVHLRRRFGAEVFQATDK